MGYSTITAGALHTTLSVKNEIYPFFLLWHIIKFYTVSDTSSCEIVFSVNTRYYFVNHF